MPLYTVQSIDAHGNVVTSQFDASSVEDANERLSKQGLKPLKIETKSSFQFKSHKFALQLFLYELRALLQAGLSLIESLETLVERQHSPQDREVLEQLVNAMYRGESFSQALKNAPHVFNDLLRAIVAASEQTGEMVDGLSRYLRYDEQLDLVRNKIISASVYPVALLIVGALVATFLLFYLVPRFSMLYESLSTDLPWGSRLLLQWGKFIAVHPFWMMIAVGAALLLLVALLQNQSNRQKIVSALQRLPGIKPHVRLIQLSRFYRALGLLLYGGIPVTQALKLTKTLLPLHMQVLLSQTETDIAKGMSLSDSLTKQDLTTAVSTRLIRAGEQNGEVAAMLDHTANFHETEVSRWIDRVTRLLEPALMLSIGLIIGTIVVLLYLPIFDLASNLR
jgi:general secretion pathway protein F